MTLSSMREEKINTEDNEPGVSNAALLFIIGI
jgi:hypothetical protein